MKLEIHRQAMWIRNTKLLKLIFLQLFLFTAFFSNALDYSVKKSKELVYDSSAIEIRELSEEQIRELQDDPAYSYTKEVAPPKTAWERFKEWFWNKIEELFDTKAGNVTIKAIQFLLIAGAILFIVLALIKNNIRAIFYGKSAVSASDFNVSAVHIDEVDFDKQIKEEVLKKNFRSAVRLCFLKIIKELNQHHLISWKQDKTNNDYLKELKNGVYYKQFEELSWLYEYIWYGDFILDEHNFLTVIQKFDQFKIKTTD